MKKSSSKGGNKSSTITNPRDAITGKFVTPGYARKHPKTTETEHNKKNKK